MKIYIIISLLLASVIPTAIAQPQVGIDSLKRLLIQTRQDTSRVLLLVQLSNNYRFFNPDSSMLLAQQAMQLAGNANFPKGEARAFFNYGEARRFRGDYPQALEAQFKALQISKSNNFLEEEELSLGSISFVYSDLQEYRQSLNYLFEAKKINEIRSDKYVGSRWLSSIGNVYEKMNMLDSALFFLQQAYAFSSLFPANYSGTFTLTRLGVVQLKLGHVNLALHYLQQAIQSSYVINDLVNLSRTQYHLAALYHSVNKTDSSLYYCRLAFINANLVFLKFTILDASVLLSKLYKEKNNLDSAFHYQEVAMTTKDSMYGREKFQQLQLLTLSQQQRQHDLLTKQDQVKARFQLIGLLSAMGVFLLIALLLWRNNRHKQRAFAMLQKQKEETDKQKAKVELTLEELKSTQAQLIQSEKMASLGELTAGIAHEIQNPLNFVNNYSEVNVELVEELREEFRRGNTEEVESIITDLADNEAKIHHHGQRADAIVRGMLQHSRSSSGTREPTNLNALADEYLRLAYHGLRAKDTQFQAEFITDFDKDLPLVEVVPQDMGRVLLNIIDNAFQACAERSQLQPEEYKPRVTVTTKRLPDAVEVRIADNGSGIPEAIKGKIFQPFFTTKPTGEGTGLGLSLAYDIVAKGHSGTLDVESEEGEGSVFVVVIPITTYDALANRSATTN